MGVQNKTVYILLFIIRFPIYLLRIWKVGHGLKSWTSACGEPSLIC